MTPVDDLDQLLFGLRLSWLRAILGRELAHAEAQGPSYSDFLARLLREEYQHQQERFAVLIQLGELDFLARAENIVFIGPTGSSTYSGER